MRTGFGEPRVKAPLALGVKQRLPRTSVESRMSARILWLPVSTAKRNPSSSSTSTWPIRASTTRPRTTYAEPCTCSSPLSGSPGCTSASTTRCREPAIRSPGCTWDAHPAGWLR